MTRPLPPRRPLPRAARRRPGAPGQRPQVVTGVRGHPHGVHQRGDAHRPHQADRDLQGTVGEEHRRRLGDVGDGRALAQRHRVEVQGAVGEPHQPRPDRGGRGGGGQHADRQGDDHSRAAVLLPLPRPHGRDHRQHGQQAQHQGGGDEEMLGLVAQIVMHPLAGAGERHHGADRRRDPRPQRADQQTGHRRASRDEHERAHPRPAGYGDGRAGASGLACSLTVAPPGRRSRPHRGASSAPATRRADLHHHPAPARRAEPGRLEAQLSRCRHGGAP
ncbi:transmembrane domain protein [Mycobacterium intracellulare]|nr:transmembrane domain protein [Mycobacterium intracellulare]